MKKLQNDLDILLLANKTKARHILFKIESQILYCKKYEYSLKAIRDALSEFQIRISANKYDKSRESDVSFIKNGIMYLHKLCTYD